MKKSFKSLMLFSLLFVAVVLSVCSIFQPADIWSVFSFAIAPIVAHKNNFQRNEDIYSGEGDISLSYSGGNASSFLDEIQNTMEFSFRITNTNNSKKAVLLFPGYFNTTKVLTEIIKNHNITTGTVSIEGTEYELITAITSQNVEVVIGVIYHDISEVKARGLNVDAMIGSGVVGTGISCESLSKGSIEDFINFVKINPTRIPEITIASNNIGQYSRQFVIKKINPAADWGEDYIRLQKYFSTAQYRDEKISVPTDQFDLQLDDQTLLYLEVEAAKGEVPTFVDITLKLGASLNNASWLYNKALVARNTIRNAAANLLK